MSLPLYSDKRLEIEAIKTKTKGAFMPPPLIEFIHAPDIVIKMMQEGLKLHKMSKRMK